MERMHEDERNGNETMSKKKTKMRHTICARVLV